MPTANLIRWRDGAGWLVLSGGNDSIGEDAEDIEALALARVPAGKPLAYIWAASDVETADERLAALDELGAPTGYLVDILTEDDDSLHQQLSDAGLIVIGDGTDLEGLRSGLIGAAIEGIGAAFADGALVLAIGQGAAVLGSILDGKPGLGWIEGAIVMPHYNTANQPTRLHDLLLKNPTAYGIGIGIGSALTLGPQGQIETWGKRAVTVTLGSSFT